MITEPLTTDTPDHVAIQAHAEQIPRKGSEGFAPPTYHHPYSNDSGNTFESKVNNGWLKHYSHATLVMALLCFVVAIMEIVCMVNTSKVYGYGFGHVVAYLGYFFLTLILLAFFYFSFSAIQNRSLEKQDTAIKALVIFNFGCMFYIILYIGCAGLSETIDFGFLIPSIPLTMIGFAFQVLANSVKKAMLGKNEESLIF